MKLTNIIDDVNKHLSLIMDGLESSTVKEAVSYSIIDSGKRLRPLLLLAMVRDLNGGYESALDLACALECLHTYSLIHDDLPALDNDDMRRFKPTSHKVFGEAYAILAGDSLLTLAFELASKNMNGAVACSILAKQAGINGMILGQEIDIRNQINDFDTLLKCYELKTGCLFAAALELAVVHANRPELRETMRDFGKSLGIAFQIQDDLLEVTQEVSTIGKSTNSDKDRGKITVLNYLSLNEAQVLLDDTFTFLYAQLELMNLKHDTVLQLLKTIDKRSA